jgi:hypothetical protein
MKVEMNIRNEPGNLEENLRNSLDSHRTGLVCLTLIESLDLLLQRVLLLLKILNVFLLVRY